jgi:ABC-type transporter Mla subunit MlaD
MIATLYRRRICPETAMKKKETVWELIKRLDEQAGAFNTHMHKANHLFDTAAKETSKVLDQHQRDLHKTIVRLQKALKTFKKQNDKKKDKDSRKKDADN